MDEPSRPREAKQVIVIRRDLKMRRGKEIAQGAHASMIWLSHRVQEAIDHGHVPRFSEAEEAWLRGAFTKVVVKVNSEEELLAVIGDAYDARVPAQPVVDAGRTEFHGVPTLTTVAVGPAWSDEVDAVTGDLKPY